MAYIYTNGDRYIPLKDLEDNLVDLDDYCFDVDELMAFPVAELCNKGYITEMSCSGHAIASPHFKPYENESDLLEIQRNNVERIFADLPFESEARCACIIEDPDPVSGAFIIFKKQICFSQIPKGWSYKGRKLSIDIELTNNPLTYYRRIAEQLETLVEWIQTLQDAT